MPQSARKTALSSSVEDYLETIYHLQEKNRVARVKDIADLLGVTRGSVTGSLKSLAEKGFIDYAPYSFITLTEAGEKIALEVIRRHNILEDFFTTALRLAPAKSDAMACQVEHAVDSETIDRLLEFLDFIKACPRAGEDWLDLFLEFCAEGVDPARCPECGQNVLAKIQTA